MIHYFRHVFFAIGIISGIHIFCTAFSSSPLFASTHKLSQAKHAYLCIKSISCHSHFLLRNLTSTARPCPYPTKQLHIHCLILFFLFSYVSFPRTCCVLFCLVFLPRSSVRLLSQSQYLYASSSSPLRRSYLPSLSIIYNASSHCVFIYNPFRLLVSIASDSYVNSTNSYQSHTCSFSVVLPSVIGFHVHTFPFYLPPISRTP